MDVTLPPKFLMRPEDLLTAGQRVGLQYSRDRYNDGTYQVNGGPDPSVTSFMGAISPAPEGGYINHPAFWGGKVLTQPNGKIDFDAALARALAYEQQTGQKFARYGSLDTADAGEAMVHQIMDADSQRVLATPEAQARLRAMGGR